MNLQPGSLLRQGTVAARYQTLVSQNGICHDAAQAALALQFDLLCLRLQQHEALAGTSWFGKLLKRKTTPPTKPRGLYIHGDVGRGKTMLMDLFYDHLPLLDKKRAHFNDFMNDVQNRLHSQREKLRAEKTKNADPIPPIAADLARESRILCFDEFSVTDIADAMILGRLFAALFDEGVILVATSNVAPDDLYKNGLNRALFLPFIDILKTHVDIFNLDSSTDYRLEKGREAAVYFFPLDEMSTAQINAAWEEVAGRTPITQETLSVRGHDITIPQVALGAARFDFRDLCAKPLGAYDYLALVKNYHTFFIDHVPLFDNTMRNEAKRFILLVDTLYEAKSRVFIRAAAAPNRLYHHQQGYKITEHFEFERTVSRLFEMQSKIYIDEWTQKQQAKTAAIELN